MSLNPFAPSIAATRNAGRLVVLRQDARTGRVLGFTSHPDLTQAHAAMHEAAPGVHYRLMPAASGTPRPVYLDRAARRDTVALVRWAVVGCVALVLSVVAVWGA